MPNSEHMEPGRRRVWEGRRRRRNVLSAQQTLHGGEDAQAGGGDGEGGEQGEEEEGLRELLDAPREEQLDGGGDAVWRPLYGQLVLCVTNCVGLTELVDVCGACFSRVRYGMDRRPRLTDKKRRGGDWPEGDSEVPRV